MSVKGYTREEMDRVVAKRRMNLVRFVAALLFMLVAANVAFTIANVGMLAAMVSTVLFVFLWANYSKAVNAIAEEGNSVKPYMLYRWIILAVYLVSFVLAMFS